MNVTSCQTHHGTAGLLALRSSLEQVLSRLDIHTYWPRQHDKPTSWALAHRRTSKACSAGRRRAGLLLGLRPLVAGVCLSSRLHATLSMLASASTCSLARFRVQTVLRAPSKRAAI